MGKPYLPTQKALTELLQTGESKTASKELTARVVTREHLDAASQQVRARPNGNGHERRTDG